MILLFSVWVALCTIHDIHLSKSEIIFNPETSTIQVSTNIFLDDLENALLLKGVENLKLFTAKEDSLADTHISAYLFEHIVIQTEVGPVPFQYVGKEISEDLTSVWCYFESEVVDVQQEAQIHNTILLQLFDDQRNITVIKKGRERGKHYILDHDDPSILKDAEN